MLQYSITDEYIILKFITLYESMIHN